MQTDQTNNSNLKKLAAIILAAFAAAVFTGFVSRGEAFKRTDLASRKDLMTEMARIISTLTPLLENSAFSDVERISNRELPVELELVAGLGIIKSFPDGTWKLSQKITRGESIFYFDQFYSLLCKSMRIKPDIIETGIPFPDINQEHWLRSPLNRLGGTGALMFSEPASFQADQIISGEELRFIGSAIIEYLANNLLLVFFDGKSIKVSGKGASHEVSILDWTYSYDSIKWHKLPEDGAIDAHFDNRKVCRIFFRNETYINSGPIRLYDQTPTVASIKLQKNLSAAARSATAKTTETRAQDKPDTESERERLRKRLAELRNAKLLTGNLQKEADNTTKREKKLPVELTPEINNTEPVHAVKAEPGAQSVKPEPAVQTVLPTEVKNIEQPAEMTVHTKNSHEELVLPEGTTRYEARIFDALSGKRLSGAMLMTGASQISADAEGKMFFNARPDSIIEITAYCEGYETLQMKHRAGYRQGPLVLSLKPVLTSFSGRIICEETGSPVAKALIKLGDRATRSDDNGNFTIKTLPGGYHQLSCFADRYMEAHEIVYVEKNAGTPFQLVLKPILTMNSAYSSY